MPNKWIEHVKDYQAKHNCSYRHALSNARDTYMTGSGGKNAGYIRRLIAEKNENFDMADSVATVIGFVNMNKLEKSGN